MSLVTLDDFRVSGEETCAGAFPSDKDLPSAWLCQQFTKSISERLSGAQGMDENGVFSCRIRAHFSFLSGGRERNQDETFGRVHLRAGRVSVRIVRSSPL